MVLLDYRFLLVSRRRLTQLIPFGLLMQGVAVEGNMTAVQPAAFWTVVVGHITR